MSIFRMKKPQPQWVDEAPKSEPEKKVQPLAYGYNHDVKDVIFSSNVTVPVKISFRPKGDDEKKFSIELYIAADLNNTYLADGFIFGEWFTVADVTKGLDGFYDVTAYHTEIDALDRGLDVRLFGETLALEYLNLLQDAIESQNDSLYSTGVVFYSQSVTYYSSDRTKCDPPPPKSYIAKDLSFHDVNLSNTTRGHLVVFKDLSVRFAQGYSNYVWRSYLSQKTCDKLDELGLRIVG